jgi:predicted nucleic acid-binding protein
VRVLLDTNILTRIANGEGDPDYASAEGSVEELRYIGHTLCLVPQNLYEFWAVATRPLDANGLGMTPSEAHAELDRFKLPLFLLLQDERAIFPKWKELIRNYDVKGKVSYDTRLVAAMLRHGITHLLTFNVAHFIRFKEIEVLTPQEVLAGSRGQARE